MTNQLEDFYAQTKRRLSTFDKEKKGDEPEEMLTIVQEWREFIDAVETKNPEIARKYERKKGRQESFTQDQINFICEEIGNWYLEWQDKMWIDGKPNQHWLGFAKEQLKTMICGD